MNPSETNLLQPQVSSHFQATKRRSELRLGRSMLHKIFDESFNPFSSVSLEYTTPETISKLLSMPHQCSKEAILRGGASYLIRVSSFLVSVVSANGLSDPKAWSMYPTQPSRNLSFSFGISSIRLQQNALRHFQRYQIVVRNYVARSESPCLPLTLASIQVLQNASGPDISIRDP